VSALTCWRVHRGVGIAATLCASLIGLSTPYAARERRLHHVRHHLAGIDGLEFIPGGGEKRTLTVRDAQHEYVFAEK